jgi:hypothetical protein
MALTRPQFRQINTTSVSTSDPITILNQGAAQANVDVGFLFNRANGLVPNVALYWCESSQSLSVSYTNDSGHATSNISVVSYANLKVGTVVGNVVANTISADGFFFANGAAFTSYTDLDVAAYLPSDSTIVGIQSNITGANAAIVTANTALKSYVDAQDSAITSAWTANAQAVQSQLTGANAAIVAANLIQSGQIDTLKSQVYTNANVDAHLSSSGAGNITINSGAFNLTASGPGAITVGSATAIPVITTDAYGRITALTTASVSSTLNTSGTTGTGSVSLTNQTLTFDGTYGVTATASGQTITIATPQDLRSTSSPTFSGLTSNGNTVVNSTAWINGQTRITNGTASSSTSTGALQVSGGVGIGGDVYIGGNLTAASLNSTTYTALLVNSSLAYLQGNVYPYDFDIGFYSHFRGGPANVYSHTGVVRSSQNGYYGFFSNVRSEPAGTVNWADSGLIWDTVKAGALVLANSTSSTSTTTGALQVAGGAGIAGNVYAGSVYTSGLYWSANGNVMASGITFTASSTAPASGNKGDQWYNTTNDVMYEYITDGSSTYWIDTSTPVVNGSSAAGISANLTPVVNGNIYITGNLVPTSNVTYDLGSPTNAFKSLFLSGNTIVLGGHTIKSDPATGAIAFIPPVTVATPNPIATIFNPAGLVTTYTTTGGLFNPSTAFTQAAAATNSIMPSLNVQGQTTIGGITSITGATTINGLLTINADITTSGKLTVTNGVFWANGTAYSSGGGGTYSNTNVASYLLTNTGNIAAGSIAASGKIVTTTGVFWANGTAYSSGAGGGGSSGTTTNALSLGYGLANDSDLLYSFIPPTVDTADHLGSSVATNGIYTIASAHGSSAIYVYLNSTGALQYKISGVSGFVSPGQDTRSVAINSANVIVVSDTQYGSYGRAQIFDMSTWSAYSGSTITINSATATLTPPDSSGTFGRAVAISDSYIVVSNPSANTSGNNYAGIVYLYSTSGTLKYKITDPNAWGTTLGDGFGVSVAISGNKLVVGAPYEGDTTYSGSSMVGKVYAFNIASFPAYSGSVVTISSANYTSYGFVINNPFSESQSPELGYAVATDGTYIAATAINTKGNVQPNSTTVQFVGAVYVFDASNGTYLRRINSPAPITNGGQYFGQSLAISGSNLLIGESYGDVGYNIYVSSAYLYSTSDWKLKKVISSPNAVAGQGGYQGGDLFGHSVAISGNYAVVGAPSETQVTAQNWPYGKGGAAYLFNVNRTFDGSAAMTVSLAPTTVVPGLYGLTDGSSYIDVPQLQIDHYGRVLGATQQRFGVTQGIDHAFGAILVNGSEAFTASSVDSVNFAAGTNVTLSAATNGSGQKTITINSTGGSAGGGGGASNPFVAKIGPTALSYSGGDTTFTAPATGKLLVQAVSYSGDNVIAVGGPGLGPFGQLMGAPIYGPGGMTYPYYSYQSINSGTTVHVSMMSGGSGTVDVLAWTLDSATDPNAQQVWYGPSSGYSPDGTFMMNNSPQMMGSQYWSQFGYFYGLMYSQGGSLSGFTPAPGVTAQYDSSVMMVLLKVPGSIWASGGVIGSSAGYSGGYGCMGYFFGNY